MKPNDGVARSTELLIASRRGDPSANQGVFPIVYDELRRIAADYLHRDPSARTLQATALVHEAYLRLMDQSQLDELDRQHYQGIAARVMRQILVEHARARHAKKRGGELVRVTFDENTAGTVSGVDVLGLEEALTRLEALDERLARIVELRVFLGMKILEVGAVLGVSRGTVDKDWAAARAWLRRELS